MVIFIIELTASELIYALNLMVLIYFAVIYRPCGQLKKLSKQLPTANMIDVLKFHNYYLAQDFSVPSVTIQSKRKNNYTIPDNAQDLPTLRYIAVILNTLLEEQLQWIDENLSSSPKPTITKELKKIKPKN